MPTATDNCGGTVTVTNDATLPITSQGPTVITWTYDDGNGNISTQTQNTVIDDITLPTITCEDDIKIVLASGQTSMKVDLAVLTTDNCAVASVENDSPIDFFTRSYNCRLDSN
jgi:hypothetical protein